MSNASELLLVALFVVSAMLAGCGQTRSMKSETLLFDGAAPPKEMYHVTVVPDPFAAGGSATQPAGAGLANSAQVKVLKGGALGPSEPTHANKCTFVKGDGFFKMPASGDARLDLFVGVRGLREMRIEVHAKDPTCGQVFHLTLPAESSWQEVPLTLDPAKIKPGCTVNDITVFQIGPDKSPASKLYVRSVSLRTY